MPTIKHLTSTGPVPRVAEGSGRPPAGTDASGGREPARAEAAQR